MELTSPAGNFEKGKMALIYGADSVYTGFPGFSLRAGAEKSDLEELKKLIDFAQGLNKKVFLAVNIFAHNRHVARFQEALEQIRELAPHGLILADPGLMLMAREALPDMHLTVSTQANTTNYQTFRLWEKLGINRVVLARELALEEIREIRDKTSLEMEIFAHGAVCMAYSGRCLLSGFMTEPKLAMTHTSLNSPRARHANLGDCIQPCRFKFAVIEENRRDLAFPIEEDEFGTYLFSAKDLCLINRLNELKQAGVDVIKIEGRMKSIYYAANITRVYRKALDLLKTGEKISDEDKAELYKVSHRGYSEGFTFLTPESTRATFSGYQKSYRFHALVEEKRERNFRLKVFNSLNQSQTLEVIGPEMKNLTLRPGDFRLLDRHENPVETLKHGSGGWLNTDAPLEENDIIRIQFG